VTKHKHANDIWRVSSSHGPLYMHVCKECSRVIITLRDDRCIVLADGDIITGGRDASEQ